MEHRTSLTQHIHATPEKVWAVISDIPGSAAIIKPTFLSKVTMALFGKLGMSMTSKALTKDLAEIAAKAESL